jgi:elongation factor Ts
MSEITTDKIKDLRERTGCGMMECKKALVDAKGDIDAAVEIMRKAGQAKAAKKAARIAADGVIAIKTEDDKKVVFMVEINTETDFASRDENFQKFAEMVAKRGLEGRADDVPALLDLNIAPDIMTTIAEARLALVAKIGENIEIRRLILMKSEYPIATYLHGNRIGVLVELSADNQELGRDIAMHIAAMKPEVVNPEDIPAATIRKEKEIFLAQMGDTKKPPEIMEKMMAGRMQKFMNEISLVGQPFVKDPNTTIKELLTKANVKVLNFARFEVGEGIEKEVKDFASEVQAQIDKTK